MIMLHLELKKMNSIQAIVSHYTHSFEAKHVVKNSILYI